MASVLILAHAPLASALKAVAAHVYPERGGDVEAIDVAADATPEQTVEWARARLATRPDSDWLVLVDVCGATPCNAAQRLADSARIRVLAGVNVPMLWRSMCYADLPLDELVARAQAGAAQGVTPIAAARPPQAQPSKRARADDDHPDPQ